MKLLFVLPLMSGTGGIQASLLNLLNEVGPEPHEVTLCVFGNYVSPDTPLPAWVRVVPGPRVLEYCLADFASARARYSWHELPVLAATKVIRRLLGYRRVLDAALRRFRVPGHFDVAIAYANDIYAGRDFVGGSNDIVRRCVDADRRVAWIHNDATRHGLDEERSLRTYADFDAVVNVSEACKEIFDRIVPTLAPKSTVVLNMMDTARIERLARAATPYDDSGSFRIVTVARLDNRQKRLDRVVDACAELKAIGVRPFTWHVVGGGPDADMLTRRARDRGVEDVLTFVGHTSNPFPYVAGADLFVLTSDYEAYGMVLAEALTLGVPVVSTRFPAAPEVVDDGENGVLT
ncbi:MAG TPA: glycosyltransferase, partial [Propionibacteriaceae bacterium]|nr:glycosyltransferase [Propionibacteriaceae bacterium]